MYVRSLISALTVASLAALVTIAYQYVRDFDPTKISNFCDVVKGLAPTESKHCCSVTLSCAASAGKVVQDVFCAIDSRRTVNCRLPMEFSAIDMARVDGVNLYSRGADRMKCDVRLCNTTYLPKPGKDWRLLNDDASAVWISGPEGGEYYMIQGGSDPLRKTVDARIYETGRMRYGDGFRWISANNTRPKKEELRLQAELTYFVYGDFDNCQPLSSRYKMSFHEEFRFLVRDDCAFVEVELLRKMCSRKRDKPLPYYDLISQEPGLCDLQQNRVSN
jgi:hypothetical protein